MALNADKPRKSNVTRLHPTVIVRRPHSFKDTEQPQQAQIPLDDVEAPPVEVPEVAGKKGNKRSPESIAKQKATLAKKKRGNKGKPVTATEFIKAHPDVPASELVKLAAGAGIKVSASYIYNIRSVKRLNGAATRKPKRQGVTAAIAAELQQSPLDTVLDMLRLADHAQQTLGAGSKKRLLAELTSRLS